MNGHGLNITHDSNGIRIAECECGAPIHKRVPNRRKPNIALEEFMRESNTKHRQHLLIIVERDRLKILLSAVYGKKPGTYYQETDNMTDAPTPCKLNYSNQGDHQNQGGAHNYTAINTTTIYCTQCGDVQTIGGVVEDEAELSKQLYEKSTTIRELRNELACWKSWYVPGETRDKISHYIRGVIITYIDNPMSAPDIHKQTHAILESIHGFIKQ